MSGGLYNTVFGSTDEGPVLVAILNEVQKIEIGRFRDAWVETHGDDILIRIHTRSGGGNREDYEVQIESMRQHPWFLRDADDDFDCTYADFYFLTPKDHEVRFDLIAKEPVNMGELWQGLFK